jgi:6-phosphogluconolactonase
MTDTIWWGTYPEAGLGTPTGTGEGLWRQTAADAHLALALPAPSFVVAHPMLPLLYAICETDATEVVVIDVSDQAAPSVLATVATGGDAGCHLLLGRDARTLYASHYMSGELAVISLGADGLPSSQVPDQVFGHDGSGPRADRQEGPHAHFAGFAPGERHVLVCDLGTDELRRYVVGEGGLLEANGVAATLPAGSGPRHFAVRGERIYVLCELDSTLRTLRWDPASATAEVIDEVASTPVPNRTGEAGSQDSHVLLVDDEVLLAGVRGADVIAIFDLSPEGDVRYRTSFDAGFWPRHFAIVGDRLHVGAERGHEVRAYALADVLALPAETEVGQVVEVTHASAALPSPACAVAG